MRVCLLIPCLVVGIIWGGSLDGSARVVNAEWIPGEASVTVFEGEGVVRHYQWPLTSAFSNAHRDLVLKCWGRCDYIPQIFQCSGNLTRQHCRIETRPGYELKSITLEHDLDLESQLELHYFMRRNSSCELTDGQFPIAYPSNLSGICDSTHNCDPKYFNWVELHSMQLYITAHVIVVIAGLLCGFGYFQTRPIQEYLMTGFGFLCLFSAIAGFYHLSSICTSISNQ